MQCESGVVLGTWKRKVDAGATTEREESGTGSAGVKLKKAGSASNTAAALLSILDDIADEGCEAARRLNSPSSGMLDVVDGRCNSASKRDSAIGGSGSTQEKLRWSGRLD